MSGAGLAKRPKIRWCWSCSKQLHGNFHRVVWGPDGHAYAGRRMTLYRDDTVAFGGMAVGGIRISHMTHIDKPQTMALTATRAKRAPFTVQPLVVAGQIDVAALLAQFDEADDADKFSSAEKARADVWARVHAPDKVKLKEASDKAKLRTSVPISSEAQT